MFTFVRFKKLNLYLRRLEPELQPHQHFYVESELEPPKSYVTPKTRMIKNQEDF
jgi:hypothetical protein